MRRLASGIPTALLLALLGSATAFAQQQETKAARAARIHAEVLTVDTHVDTPLRLVRSDYDLGVRHDVKAGGGRLDFPRMKAGGLDAVFFAVFLGQGERTPAGHAKAVQRARGLFAAIEKSLASNPDLAELAKSPADAYRLEALGKRAIFLGIENGYALGGQLALLEEYHTLGTRYITLCHTRNNDICDSSTDPGGAEHNGLSEFGEKVVKEMNRLGMMIDVSHASDASFRDAIAISKAPIMASHSCARALCASPRNLDDEMLRALAKNGGVIQICFVGSYLEEARPDPEREKAIAELRKKYGEYSELSRERQGAMRAEWREIGRKYPEHEADVATLVDHIDHVVQKIGVDHVGIGTDFDGGGALRDCADVAQMGTITRELVERGYTDEQIRKIWGGNVMRVFRETERVAARLAGRSGRQGF